MKTEIKVFILFVVSDLQPNRKFGIMTLKAVASRVVTSRIFSLLVPASVDITVLFSAFYCLFLSPIAFPK